MKSLIEVHFDELLLVGVIVFFAVLYFWRPEAKEWVAGALGALYLSLKSKTKDDPPANK